MSDVETLAAALRAELSRAREELGLPDLPVTGPEEMLAEAKRIADVVDTRMRTIKDQLITLDTTRSAARSYLSSDTPA